MFFTEEDTKREIIIDTPLSLLWGIYYRGSGNDYGSPITTEQNGNVLITGYTSSTDSPIYNPGGVYFQGDNAGGMDLFVLKFQGIPVQVKESHETKFILNNAHTILTHNSITLLLETNKPSETSLQLIGFSH